MLYVIPETSKEHSGVLPYEFLLTVCGFNCKTLYFLKTSRDFTVGCHYLYQALDVINFLMKTIFYLS